MSPRRLMTVAAAFMLSTLFGMGLALFLEYLDDTIRTTDEIETYLQLPALAAIPTMDSMPKRKLLLVGSNEGEETGQTSELLISADPRSSLAGGLSSPPNVYITFDGRTSFQISAYHIEFCRPRVRLRRRQILPSALPRRVRAFLIIDADMRRPRLHSIFSIENGVGLSTLLSSELTDAEISGAIRVDERSKLNLLTSGPIPPNPAELIGSEQMATLLRMLQSRFTHIVIDSPPIASFTDGVLIASMVDGVILVVHAGKSSRQVVRRSRQLLQEIGQDLWCCT